MKKQVVYKRGIRKKWSADESSGSKRPKKVKRKTVVNIHDNEGVDEDVSKFVQLQDQREQIRKKGKRKTTIDIHDDEEVQEDVSGKKKSNSDVVEERVSDDENVRTEAPNKKRKKKGKKIVDLESHETCRSEDLVIHTSGDQNEQLPPSHDADLI